MIELESGKDKVKKICDVLRKETLDPAREEAHKIKEEAQEEKRKILAEAREEAQKILQEATVEIEKKMAVFESSLKLASRQAVASFKHQLEHFFFDGELKDKIQKATQNADLIERIIDVLLTVAHREGPQSDLLVELPANINKEEVVAHLVKAGFDKVSVNQSPTFTGGAKLKIQNQNLTLDMTDTAIIESLSRFLRDDFRHFLFQS